MNGIRPKQERSTTWPCLIATATWLAFAAASVCARAASCPVIHGAPQDPAEKAFLAGNPGKAADIYKAELAQHPNSPNLTAGLVQALLQQQNIAEADATVQSALAQNPHNSILLTARGEVEYRQGFPWKAAQSAILAANADPCNAQNMLLIAKIARLNSEFATAARSATTAHLIRPDDPEIRREWIAYLPPQQQVAQLETDLSQPPANDTDNPLQVRRLVNHLHQIDNARMPACHLVSPMQSADIPLQLLGNDPAHGSGLALDAELNGHPAHLQVDTGADGLNVTRDMARRAGLVRIGKSRLQGIGSGKRQTGYLEYADSIRIGGLEFQNCSVRVVEDKRGINGLDGLIGMDVFAPFLITLDYPRHTLSLDPLPARPGHAARPPRLDTERSSIPNPEQDAGPIERGAFDRYIAPEMKTYTPVYRVGQHLMLPVSLNGKDVGLFILDTGAWQTAISSQAAAKVTELSSTYTHVHGIDGNVDKVYSAAQIKLRFANIEQQVSHVIAFDMSNMSRDFGIRVSGFLGATTLQQLTMHIDYRDGLVKFDYRPNQEPAH